MARQTNHEALENLPATRQLLLAWALLMALTLGTMLAGKVASAATLGLGWAAALLAITWAKARTILLVYLNLRAAPAHWRSGFGAVLVAMLVLLLGLYALGYLDLLPKR